MDFNTVYNLTWISGVFLYTHDYLMLKTFFVVISNPLILFGGIWNSLVLNPVDTGPF